MKRILFGFAIVASGFIACQSAPETTANSENNMNNGSMMDSTMDHTMSDGSHMGTAAQSESIDNVVSAYLQVKNALATDNAKDAATAGSAVVASIEKVDHASMPADQQKVFNDVKDDIKEHGEHIANNESKIAHQREHFEMLSKDVYDLVKATGTSQTLYMDHCPMYNNNKGANWLSEAKEIKNPYLGKSMPTCGTIKEEIKQ